MRREERFTVGELARVDVDIGHRLGAGAHRRPPARIEVVVDAGTAEQFDISQLGDRLRARPVAAGCRRGGKANVSLVVPARTDMTVNVATAEVDLRGELGALRAAHRVVGRSPSRRPARSRRTARRATCASAPPARCTRRARRATSASAASAGALRARRRRRAMSSAEHVGGDVEVGTTSGDIRLRRCDGDDIARQDGVRRHHHRPAVGHPRRAGDLHAERQHIAAQGPGAVGRRTPPHRPPARPRRVRRRAHRAGC